MLKYLFFNSKIISSVINKLSCCTSCKDRHYEFTKVKAQQCLVELESFPDYVILNSNLTYLT